MSFEPPPQNPLPPKPPSQEPILDGEIVDLNGIRNNPDPFTPHQPNQRYTPRGFKDIYEEAKWLRKLSGNTAIAFMLIFLVLLSAGAYADAVEFRRLSPEIFAEMADSLANSPEMLESEDTAMQAIIKDIARDAANTPPPGFLELFGLKILSALGSIGFFVFASAAVSEISFRAYEGREMEPYDVLDNLTKSHGIRLLQLGGFFLVLLLLMGVLSIVTEPSESTPVVLIMVAAFFVQFYFQLRMSFSVQALIGEDLSPRDAIIRSWKLTQGNLLRLIWWSLIFGLIFMLVAFFVYFIPIFLVAIIIGTIFSWAIEVIAIVMSVVAVALMVKHFSLIFFFQMALYRELRLRNDGVDPILNDGIIQAKVIQY